MFEKFGKFNTVEELNKAAEGLKAEGDTKSLMMLAEENGIEKEDAQDYIDGCIPEFATPFQAAFGRLEVERKEIEEETDKNIKRAQLIILTVTRTLCSDTEIQAEIMKKKKGTEKIYKAMREEAQKHKSGNVGIACGTDRELENIIRAYYTTGKVAEKIKELYA